jgi:hypothetical protein
MLQLGPTGSSRGWPRRNCLQANGLAPITRAFRPVPTPTPVTTGDANCDGQTDSRDAALILQVTAGLLSEMPCTDRIDLDRNGRIDSVDALLILQCSAGLRSCR